MHLMTFLNAMGTKHRIPKAIVIAPSHLPVATGGATLDAPLVHRWCVKCNYRPVKLVSTLQILPMIVVLALVWL